MSDEKNEAASTATWQRVLIIGVLLLAVCVFVADALSPQTLAQGRWTFPPDAHAGQSDAEKTRAATARSVWPAAAQSREYRVAAGEMLIVALPDALRRDTLGTQPVEAYALLRAPALSDVADRSFAWRTRPQDAGEHRILLEATFAGAPPDTLTLDVTVE